MPYKRRPYPKRRLKKRWTFEGGFKTPLGFSANARLSSRGIKSLVKREIQKHEESHTYAYVASSSTLKHNTLYTTAPTQVVVRGDAGNQRTGDQIYLRYLKLHGVVGNRTTQDQSTFRVLLVKCENRFTATNPDTTWFSGVGISNIFFAALDYAYALVDPNLECKVLYDKLYTVRANQSGTLNTQQFEASVPIMKMLTYDKQNQTYFKDEQYYWVVIPSTPNGVTGTTDVGLLNLTGIVTYRDS